MAMRQVMIAVAVMSGASAAGAQERVVTHGPGAAPMPGRHWGERTGGYWIGGMRAPGGYRAYHRPVRGYAVPAYWLAPDFLIGDWAAYGLPRPFGNYHWSRYYDDAVLIDDRGSVYDSVEGVDWDRANGAGEANASGAGAGYPPPPPGAGYDVYHHHDSGAGGAIAGAAVGGTVGAIAGGRHDRVGGALIGAGAGALAGYAINRAGDHQRDNRMPPPPPYGAGYPPPPARGYEPGRYPPPYPPAPGYPPAAVVAGGTTTTVTTTTSGYGGGGGTWVNGAYYGPGVTTITVQSAPIVTTTTTELIEDSVTYTRPVTRRTYVRRAWHPRGKLQCRCGS
jgi:Ni/Co efflux regulator RcnB